MLKNKKGISLIVLIITILVILILTSIIVMSFDNNNPIGRANEAKFKADLTSFRDELMTTHIDKSITNVDYVKEEINVGVGNLSKMKFYIPDITEEYANKLIITRGNLLYNNDETSEDYDEKEKKWAKDVGIQSPYENPGDADGDGKITQNDRDFIHNVIAGKISKSDLSEKQLDSCDFDRDGDISTRDVTFIDNYINGLE